MGYNQVPRTILTTELFDHWFEALRDRLAKARIEARLRRVELGNFGDIKSVGNGVGELRIDFGPGYRIYLAQRGLELVILLAGGDKATQARDIAAAIKLARQIEEMK